MSSHLEYLRELYRIVERRQGAVYRTAYIRDVWVTSADLLNPPEDCQYVAKSTSFTGPTIRRVQDE